MGQQILWHCNKVPGQLHELVRLSRKYQKVYKSLDDLIKAIATNTATIESYIKIPLRYKNLMNLQYS